MEQLGCIDLSKCDREITLDLSKVSLYDYNSFYRCAWIVRGTPLEFSFALKELKKIALELEVCDVLQSGKLDTRFDILLNGTVILKENQEDNWWFHTVYCNVPDCC